MCLEMLIWKFDEHSEQEKSGSHPFKVVVTLGERKSPQGREDGTEPRTEHKFGWYRVGRIASEREAE